MRGTPGMMTENDVGNALQETIHTELTNVQ